MSVGYPTMLMGDLDPFRYARLDQRTDIVRAHDVHDLATFIFRDFAGEGRGQWPRSVASTVVDCGKQPAEVGGCGLVVGIGFSAGLIHVRFYRGDDFRRACWISRCRWNIY